MSDQPGVLPKNKVSIQKLSDGIMKILNKLKKTDQKQKEASFCASKTRKVHPKALIERLEEFKDQCDSTKLKTDIQGMMTEVGHLCSEGDTRKFVCYDSEKDGSKLEFACVVVYKYECEGGEACGSCQTCLACTKRLVCGSCRMCKACKESQKCNTCRGCKAGKPCEQPIACGECKICERCEKCRSCGRCEECRKCKKPVACDYLLTTYSYKERVNHTGVAIGISTIASGIFFGSLFLGLGIITGGIEFTIGGAIAGAATATGIGATGSIIIGKSTDTKINVNLKNLLEACFIYEIVERNYATIENGELYLPLEN